MVKKAKNTTGTELVVYTNDKLVLNKDAHKVRVKQMNDYIESVKITMNEELIKAAEQVRTGFDDLIAKGFRRVWKMGEYLKRIETDVKKFEAGAIPKVAAYLRCSSEIIHKWLRFHEDYDVDAIDKLSNLRMAVSGGPLSWRHTEIVSRMASQQLRMQLLKVAADNDLTPDELDALIRDSFPDPKSIGRHAGGRPLKVPTTYTARLENLDKFCHQIIRNDKDMWRNLKYGFLQTIDEVPADKLPKLVNVIDKEAVKLAAAIEKLTDVHKELVKARATAADRIEEQAKSTGSDEGKAAGKKGGKGNGKGRGKAADVVDVDTAAEDHEPTLAEAMGAIEES